MNRSKIIVKAESLKSAIKRSYSRHLEIYFTIREGDHKAINGSMRELRSPKIREKRTTDSAILMYTTLLNNSIKIYPPNEEDRFFPPSVFIKECRTLFNCPRAMDYLIRNLSNSTAKFLVYQFLDMPEFYPENGLLNLCDILGGLFAAHVLWRCTIGCDKTYNLALNIMHLKTGLKFGYESQTKYLRSRFPSVVSRYMRKILIMRRKDRNKIKKLLDFFGFYGKLFN